METWVKQKDWAKAESGLLLLERFSAIAPDTPRYLGAIRRVRNRLQKRGEELADFLKQAESLDVDAEVPLRDDQDRVKGVIDIAVVGNDHTGIIDLKTGKNFRRGSALPIETRYQLAVYGVLAELEWQKPWHAYIFTIDDGLRAITMTRDEARSIVDQLIELRQRIIDSTPQASPGPETCFWCAHRTGCAEHWLAVDAGIVQDAARGRVLGVRHVDGGKVNLTLSLPDESEAVVLRLDEAAVPPLADGQQVDVFRASPSDDAAQHVWLASPLSTVQVTAG